MTTADKKHYVNQWPAGSWSGLPRGLAVKGWGGAETEKEGSKESRMIPHDTQRFLIYEKAFKADC